MTTLPGQTPDDDISAVEQLILLAILRLRPQAYGINIRDEVEQRGGRSISTGTLYAALNRLEGRRFLVTRKGEATAARGGRRKLYFDLTALGSHALQQSLKAIAALSEDLALEGVLS